MLATDPHLIRIILLLLGSIGLSGLFGGFLGVGVGVGVVGVGVGWRLGIGFCNLVPYVSAFILPLSGIPTYWVAKPHRTN